MNSQLVDKFFEAMSNSDVDTAMSVLHDDCVNHDMGSGQVMRGIEENRADMENWTNTFSDMKVEPLNHVESGDTVVDDWCQYWRYGNARWVKNTCHWKKSRNARLSSCSISRW